MEPSFFAVVNRRWLNADQQAERRLSNGLCPIGKTAGFLEPDCVLQIKARNDKGAIVIDDSAKLRRVGDTLCVKSEVLAQVLRTAPIDRQWAALYVEGAGNDARCILSLWDGDFLDRIESGDPPVRLAAFDLPPTTVTIVDSEVVAPSLYRAASSADRELFGVYASRFLDAPHIITALFSHVLAIQSDDNIRFPVQVKKVAEQLRSLLEQPNATVRVRRVERSHLDLWSSVQNQRFGFLDGGVARIPSVAGMQPMGLRVGVYSVRPGVVDPAEREKWRMMPFILGDLIDGKRPTAERPEPRRFQEAARYVLEPLSALQHLREFPDTRLLLLHGPIITQFVQYDQGEPNYLPFMAPDFLKRFEIDGATVEGCIADLPRDSSDIAMWNQFMAIYCCVMKMIDQASIPIAGVVERPTGRGVTISVLDTLKNDGLVTAAYVEKIRKELERYDITDDFLFGCVLSDGEYLTPVPIRKNPIRRARDQWKPVVRQYPVPMALLLKTEDMNFPFRVEMNVAAAGEMDFVARFLYHTARLLPHYAFPVGLDIADKYAKVPDWISRGISAQLQAGVLRRALRTGDANVVSQVRLLLATGPRDFFFRPSARI